MGILHLLENERYDLSSLRGMIVGGAAAPQSMIEAYEKKHGLTVIHAWGMTEMSPLGTVSRLKSYQLDLSEAERFAIRAKQGTSVPGVEIRAIDENGKEIAWDGKAFGELQVRGPWIIKSTTTMIAPPTHFKMAGSARAMWCQLTPKALCRSWIAPKIW